MKGSKNILFAFCTLALFVQVYPITALGFFKYNVGKDPQWFAVQELPTFNSLLVAYKPFAKVGNLLNGCILNSSCSGGATKAVYTFLK